ncbi:PatA/PatG family cyanobactin maturation protease [Komarekiella sp. 'clone 1']|uniref:PatA/PatG family cyanobactin maturation protease n=1 Tax=Komarekiella delphini-convector SJRDD-AB1 TaxID=2593771 RepID=A0AA40SWT0_9NOST|nr:PatA/PatG family cyanobactin maturation protease [Komarekiella delphini-convector]MBD6616453.1 PatA/PatG family cyanobactin maturation protease [Komarekiella delphini-convector SJRDD-AB1]
MSPPVFATKISMAGHQELWVETFGEPQICIAVLDGWVDQSHPSLVSAKLTPLEPLTPNISAQGSAAQHGTHVTSIIFGQHHGSVQGIAPQCRGLLIPIFTDGKGDAIAPCSQLDLARAILLAANHGAHIINISGGQLTPSGEADPLLTNAVRHCTNQNILIVAAAGNDGCNCLHIPGALPSVLAVGAMNTEGLPLDFSNWGEQYRTQGILALGENIPGAAPGGGITTSSGTSYATAVVSGVAALLLSLQVKRGQAPNPQAVRDAILRSAIACDDQPAPDCRRLLAGRLNVKGAMSLILQPGETMNENIELATVQSAPIGETNLPPPPQRQNPAVQAAAYSAPTSEVASQVVQPLLSSPQLKEQVNSGGIQPAACSCGGGNGTPVQLVYALGQLGFDFGTETRRDSIQQHMGAGANPQDHRQLLAYLDRNLWDTGAIIWTLNLDATPIYAIQPQGAYAEQAYERLRQFLTEQLTEGVERISIPGVVVGKVMLMSGQVVPVILPTLRCMYSWTTAALIEAVCGTPPAESASEQDRGVYGQRSQSVINFLERVYYELRNLGMTPQERAINYAATNAFNVERIFESAIQEEMDLDTIEVERSPLCRSGSECWDVKLTFFNPRRVFEQARKVYRFTVDVSDVCPVSVGRVRSWFVR